MFVTRPRSISCFGVLLAVVALAVQLAAGAVAAHGGAARALDGLVAASICHGTAAPADPGSPPHHTDCAVCPLCQIVAQTAVLGPAGLVVPVPEPVPAVAYALPPPRAPPARYAAAASARGPPGPDPG